MLFRKMLRDLKQNRTPFISIFLMAFLSVFVYAGIGGEWHGMADTLDSLYERTDFADVWIYGSDFTTDDLEAVRELPEVTSAVRRLSLEAPADLADDPLLTLHIPEEYEISTNLHLEGASYTKDKDGIWLDQLFAEAHELSVGDQLSLTVMGIDYDLEILGLILNPEYVYDYSSGEMVPDHAASGYAYLSPEQLPAELPFTTLLLTLEEGTDADALEDVINTALDGHYSVYLERENHPSHAMIDSEIEQHRMFAEVFPFVFLAIAMLTILTTMTRLVNNQRTQIGTLKAMGFGRHRIVWHFVSYGFFVSLAGSLLGAAIGPLTLPHLFYDAMQMEFTLDQWTASWHISFWFIAVICALVCSFFTWLACRNQLKDTPAQTLRPKAPKALKRNRFEKSRIWTKLGFNLQWNLRDMFRSRTRSLMAIAGVVGCMALLICAFGLWDSFDDIINWQYQDLTRYESDMSLDENSSLADAEQIASEYDGELIMNGNIEIKSGDMKKTGELLVYDDLSLIRFTDPSRAYIELPEDGFSLSYKLAEVLGVKEGDEIQWHVYGEEGWKTAIVHTLYRTPVSQGIAISRSFFEDSGYTFTPTSVITSQNVTVNPAHVTSTASVSALQASFDVMLEAMYIMVYVLIIAASLLAIVVLYNLGVLSFTERQRELATLLVLGFKSGKIRRLLVTQTIILSVVGILIGLFGGRLLLEFLISTVSESFDMMTIISPTTICISIGTSFLISVLVTFVFSRNVRRIDMVSSLKGVE